MNAEKILSSLCYFSVFFAPFLFPIIMYIFATGSVRYHAGKSLWTHLVPYLAAIIGFTVGTILMYSDYRTIGLLVIVVFALVGVYYLILNLVRGIRVLF